MYYNPQLGQNAISQEEEEAVSNDIERQQYLDEINGKPASYVAALDAKIAAEDAHLADYDNLQKGIAYQEAVEAFGIEWNAFYLDHLEDGDDDDPEPAVDEGGNGPGLMAQIDADHKYEAMDRWRW